MENSRIYKTLDNVPRILFWPVDEFMVLILPVFFGMLTGSILVMLLGLVLKPFYLKIKKACPRGSLLHRLYWRLPKHAFTRVGILKKIPASHYRRFTL